MVLEPADICLITSYKLWETNSSLSHLCGKNFLIILNIHAHSAGLLGLEYNHLCKTVFTCISLEWLLPLGPQSVPILLTISPYGCRLNDHGCGISQLFISHGTDMAEGHLCKCSLAIFITYSQVAFLWLQDLYLFSLFSCRPFQMIFSFLFLLFVVLAGRSLSLGSCKSQLLSSCWQFSRPDLHVFLTLLSLPSSESILNLKTFFSSITWKKNWNAYKTTRKKKENHSLLSTSLHNFYSTSGNILLNSLPTL